PLSRRDFLRVPSCPWWLRFRTLTHHQGAPKLDTRFIVLCGQTARGLNSRSHWPAETWNPPIRSLREVPPRRNPAGRQSPTPPANGRNRQQSPSATLPNAADFLRPPFPSY